MSDVDAFLAHYGKLGMKWGRRGGRSNSPEHSQAKSLKRNKAQHLTDAELKQAIGRMNLEKQYKDLNPKGIGRISQANKIAISILAVGTTINAAIAFVNSPAGKAVVEGVKTTINKGVK